MNLMQEIRLGSGKIQRLNWGLNKKSDCVFFIQCNAVEFRAVNNTREFCIVKFVSSESNFSSNFIESDFANDLPNGSLFPLI